jgi:8-oxo-(d)GTP phosphatase
VSAAGERTVHAAGGVVLRGVGDELEVLIVHRRRRADWSLPKGKLDPGELHRDAAVREVEEETGVLAEPLEELPALSYVLGNGDRKTIRWWRMRPVAGDPADRRADQEVDVARWLPIPDAMQHLTYRTDRDLLRGTLASLDARPADRKPSR